jgi:hypothetical protein
MYEGTAGSMDSQHLAGGGAGGNSTANWQQAGDSTEKRERRELMRNPECGMRNEQGEGAGLSAQRAERATVFALLYGISAGNADS